MVFCRQGLSAHRPLLSCQVDRPRGLVASLRLQGTLPRGRVLGAVGCQELLKAPPSRPAGVARVAPSWFTDAPGWGGAFCLCLSITGMCLCIQTPCVYPIRLVRVSRHVVCVCVCELYILHADTYIMYVYVYVCV